MHMTRKFTVLAAAAMVVLAACSSGSGSPSAAALTPVKLQLQWFPQAQFAGYFAAVDQGFYKAQGLDVKILPGGVDIVPATVVAGGGAEFGISWVPKMLASRESGADVQVIGQVFQRSGTLQVSWKDAAITKPADWKGKKVGTWGFGNEAELYAAMRTVGIDPANPSDVTIVPQQFDMNAFLNGEIDAAQAMIYNEYAQVLEATNPATGALYQPGDLNVIDYNAVGTAMLQDGVFARAGWLAADPCNVEAAVKFLKGTFKGWAFCRDNPGECVDDVLAAGTALGKGHQTWQMNEVNPLIWPSPGGIGVMDASLYDQTVAVATGGGVITAPPPADAIRTDLAQRALLELGPDFDAKGTSFQKGTVTVTAGGE